MQAVQRNNEPLGRYAAIVIAVIMIAIIPMLVARGDMKTAEKNRAEAIRKKYVHGIMRRGIISQETVNELAMELTENRVRCSARLLINYPAVFYNERNGEREELEVCLEDREIREIIQDGPFELPEGSIVGIRLIFD